ncbi:hypothetical protein O9H85_15720 [Paenibacillus filicis]|uniref:Phosphoadenosine phosphosulphate reductase domain-containing protein n=1 Tax=Paenibacillus gyeongsangnamensis TaxID=3388067 RepID=A0ABT4QAD6_9BACL|nr:hypothetical protein [Paenibacillus filicis]MCZ8513858.1 hypothetical protein [Paenibacillus filicis]
MVIHHWMGIDDLPDGRLLGEDSGIQWNRILDEEGLTGELFGYLQKQDFGVFLPIRTFLDAYLFEMAGRHVPERLVSPKHKLKVWFVREDMALLVEFFFHQPFAPYVVGATMSWPLRLEDVMEYETLSLFSDEDVRVERPAAATSFGGEEFAIDEAVPEDLERETDAAIERCFAEHDTVVANFSGGKDSSVIMQKCIRYKLAHRECKTKLIILSADTGSVDQPLMKEHIRKVQKAVAALPIDIPFIISEPDVEDSYLTCVLGRGYKPCDFTYKFTIP